MKEIIKSIISEADSLIHHQDEPPPEPEKAPPEITPQKDPPPVEPAPEMPPVKDPGISNPPEEIPPITHPETPLRPGE